jgi:ABC-type dipeptide/oligopeptide/nickel transport system ATPase component
MINIEKYFGLVHALKNINFDVGRNEIVGLIGDNGAGKSTMVKILSGVFPRPVENCISRAKKPISGSTTSRVPTHTALKRYISTNHWGRSRSSGGISSLAARSPADDRDSISVRSGHTGDSEAVRKASISRETA